MDVWDQAQPFFFPGSSETGILLIHGFTGTTSGVVEWARGLAGQGWTVAGPRLDGHGTHWTELNRVSWKDWVRNVEDAYADLSAKVRRVFVGGLSMGAALACLLAERHPEIRGILMVNNLMLVDNPLLPLAPLIRLLIPSVPAIANDLKDKTKTEVAYTVTPTGGADEFRKLLNHVKPRLPLITQPALIMKSREDHVIPIKSATYTLKRLGSPDKELVWLENSYHVATMDFDLPVIVEKSRTFIRRLDS